MNGALHTTTESSRQAIAGSLLVVSAGDYFADSVLNALSRASKACHVATSGAEAHRVAQDSAPDVVLLPEQLGDMSGLEWLREHQAAALPCDVVMVMAEDGLGRGAAALAEGAVDFLIQPLGLDQILATLALVARSRGLQSENDRLHRRLQALQSGTVVVGRSPAARRLAEALTRAAESSATVLIEGREGTGKTLAARSIHASNRRSEMPLHTEYCESLSEERLGRELTSLHGGTLVLENVDKLSAGAQSRLVRHLKDMSRGPDESQVRVLVTTSAHLPDLVVRGRFREDLYYRLNIFPIAVPSLQERREDIGVLASHFLKIASAESGIPANGFTAPALTMLDSQPWPGNVAQLQDMVCRAHASARGATIDLQHLDGTAPVAVTHPQEPAPKETEGEAGDEVREEDILAFETEEKRLLARALKATQGNVRRAAQLLRIGRATLYRKIQIYKLKLN